MSGIALAQLGEIADLQAGVSFPVDLQGRSSGDYPVAKVGDISRVGRSGEAVISAADHYIDEGDLARLRARPIPPGSVLFAKIGEAIRHNHRVIAGCALLVDNNAMAAIPTRRVDSRYLYHFLRTVDFYGLASATTVPALRKSELEHLPVPLPPLPEQWRIAEILDKAAGLRAKRRAALAQLDTLTQSIFLDMFGDPATNPKRWPVVLLRESTARIQIGPFGSLLHREDYVEGGIPLVNPKHIQQEAIQPDPSETVSARKFAELDTYHLQAGDVVMGRRGEMGRCAVVNEDSGPLLCGTGSVLVRPDNEHTTSLFLLFLLSSAALKARLERLSLGQTLPNLNSQIVEGLEVPLPPLTVQLEFAARVEGARRFVNAQRKASSQLSSLFASLQQRAFRGEL